MNKIFFLTLFFSLLLLNVRAQKFDTTVLTGRVGYRIASTNKDVDNNPITITPQGFTGFSNMLQFMIRGKVRKAQIDDFNNDGYPDLIIYTYDDKDRGQVYAMASAANKNVVGIKMDDIYSDPKLREGYEGHDQYSIMEGILYRQFPVYKTTDSLDSKEVIGKRIIQYKAESDPNKEGSYEFKVINVFDLK